MEISPHPPNNNRLVSRTGDRFSTRKTITHRSQHRAERRRVAPQVLPNSPQFFAHARFTTPPMAVNENFTDPAQETNKIFIIIATRSNGTMGVQFNYLSIETVQLITRDADLNGWFVKALQLEKDTCLMIVGVSFDPWNLIPVGIFNIAYGGKDSDW